MARSKFSNTQALDEDYAFQHELDNASGTLNTKIDTTSGTLQVQYDTHVADVDIHFPWQDVEDEVAVASGTLQGQITQNVDDIAANTSYITNVSGSLQTDIDYYSDHGNLIGLDGDDHLQYVPRDGTRGFTSTVSGVYPIEDYDLATKLYIDDKIATISGAFEELHSYEAVEYEEQTTSTDWINRMELTVSGIPEGPYRLAWYWEWRISKTGKTHSVRIVLDDDTVNLLAETDADMIRTTNWLSAAGFYHTTLSGGVHHMDMDWKIDSAQGGTTGYLRKTRLEFWRTG